MSELDSDLPFETLENTFGEVIDEPKVADAFAELERLKKVTEKKNWIDEGRYRDAEEALQKSNRSDDETNDHACALAWIALTEHRVDYWDTAISELDTLKKKFEEGKKALDGDHTRDDAAKTLLSAIKRLTFNLERIRAARDAAEAAGV